MIIAQLSDLHICRTSDTVFGGRDSARSLERCIDALNALQPQPDFAVLSGDLVNTGHLDEYIRLKSILASMSTAYYLMPGNHDVHAALRHTFPQHTYLGASGPMHYTLERPGLRVIALDTVVPGAEHGALDAPSLQWLEQALQQHPALPTIVFMHHPAFVTGIPAMDPGRVQSEAFWPLLARHPQVKRVACGHVHRPMQVQQAGIAACIAPSTAAQLALQTDANARLEVTGEPVGFLLHATVGGEIVTHYVAV